MMLSQVQVQLVGECNCLVKKMSINLRSIKVKEKNCITVCMLRTVVISWVLCVSTAHL